MSSRPPKSTLNPHVIDEAAEWFVTIEGGEIDYESRRAFDEWLRRSPEHLRAFMEMLPIWDQRASARPDDADPEHLIAWASSTTANVFALTPVSYSSEARAVLDAEELAGVGRAAEALAAPSTVTSKPRRRKLYPLAASWLVAVAAAGSFAWWHLVEAPSYSTGTAEQRSIQLPDGSTIELNARSKIRVRLSENQRDVELLQGQAMFSVAKDPRRPFVVHSGETQVRAVGTQFDVYRRRGGTRVTVLEGRVLVLPVASADAQGRSSVVGLPNGESAGNDAKGLTPADVIGSMAGATMLSAGEQTTVTRNAIEPPRSTNLSAASAWTQRRLAFEKATLAEVAEEFNRNNARQLRIVGADLETFLVSGTFSSTDPASLLRFLRAQPGIQVIETDRSIRIVSEETRRPQP